jgi:flagellar motor switch/type III secretory pathway protein FliN
VNDVLFGMGEVVVIGDNLGIRINHLLKPEDMVLN